MEMASITIDRMNGRRQPHCRKSSALIEAWVHRITTRDRIRPADEVIWIHPVNRPRRFGSQCSAT
ncbi:hypothetical protein D3C71_1865760 [compost metagenome]